MTTAERDERIRELHAAGLSHRRIAAEVGINASTVGRRLQNGGPAETQRPLGPGHRAVEGGVTATRERDHLPAHELPPAASCRCHQPVVEAVIDHANVRCELACIVCGKARGVLDRADLLALANARRR